MLEPRNKVAKVGSLKLIRADVHRAAHDARPPIQVIVPRHGCVLARIDTWRVGLQAEIAGSLVHKERCVGDVAGAAAVIGSRATVIQVVAVVIRPVRGGVVVEDAIG